MQDSLFRPEVLAHRTDRLSGDVAIIVPVSWQLIGMLLFGAVAVAMLFLSLASYTRIQTATGSIVPDKGIASVYPRRNGVVTEVTVFEGQFVSADALLVAIRAEEDGATIAPAELIKSAIDRQDASLALQMGAARHAAAAQQSQIVAKLTGLNAEIAQLETQIGLQSELVASARKDIDRARAIAERGFISTRDLQVREDTLIARQQQFSQLQQQLVSRRAILLETRRAAALIEAQADSQSADLEGARSQLAQLSANAASDRAYVLRAPVSGHVTALTARVGQSATTPEKLMAIVPSGAKLRAELTVPTSAIGFVTPGQNVRLSIDAFPYQRFGTINGKVITVAQTAVGQSGANGAVVPVYPVTVELMQSTVNAFGKNRPLMAGMTLSARIVTEDQSLLRWLFEPVFAVRKR